MWRDLGRRNTLAVSPHILAEDTTVRKFLMLPFAALLLTLALNDSSAQPPSKAKPKTPEADTSAAGLHFEVYRDSGDKYRYRIKDGRHANRHGEQGIRDQRRSEEDHRDDSKGACQGQGRGREGFFGFEVEMTAELVVIAESRRIISIS